MALPFRYYLRVRYQDCDAQHVVFNSRYSEYADITCFEFLRAALPRPTDGLDGTFEVQVVRQVIEWKSPARFDDVLEVSAWVSRIGTTSFTLSTEMRRAGEPAGAGDHRDHLRPRRSRDLHQAPHRPRDARRPGGRRARQD